MRALSFVLPACASLFIALGSAPTPAPACGFCCNGRPQTFAETAKATDVIVLAEWISAEKQKPNAPAFTRLEIVGVGKGPKALARIGDEIIVPAYHAGNEDALFLVVGTINNGVQWGLKAEFTTAAFEYLLRVPRLKVPATQRLAFFAEHLESADKHIAADAFLEFEQAVYSDLVRFAPRLSLSRLRHWVADPNIDSSRIGLYAMMLGVRGEPVDSEVLKQFILDDSGGFRLGLDGVMAGYLLLRGAQGLGLLEETKLHNNDATLSEKYAVMQAVRFLWEYAPEKITRQRLCETMRILVENPVVADLAIADLSRWKDWAVRERLMTMYGDKKFAEPSIKRAIVRYMFYCAADIPAGTPQGIVPFHAQQAKLNLAYLEKADPETYQKTKMFLILN